MGTAVLNPSRLRVRSLTHFFVFGLFCREIQAGAKLSLNRQFFDERWSKHRVVSCLDWSSQVNYNKTGCYSLICELGSFSFRNCLNQYVI